MPDSDPGVEQDRLAGAAAIGVAGAGCGQPKLGARAEPAVGV